MGNIQSVFIRHYEIYLEGIGSALYASAISLVLALIVGIIGGIARYNNKGITGKIAAGYVTVIRNTPLLIQLYFIFFGLPRLGITLSAFQTGIIGLTLNSGAYITEMVKGGLQAIPKGQYEAAEALGLTYWKSTGLIILPQALKITIPSIVNTFIGLFKDTSLVLVIGLFDLLTIIQAALTDPAWLGFAIEGYLFAGLVFWIFCFAMSRYSQALERKLHTGH